jgi:uncharacterized membrane protein (DUF2068 family)
VKIPHFERVLRTVAIFELSKGIIVLLAGLGVLSILKGNVQHTVDALIGHFHLDPNDRYPRIFIELASKITDTHLWMIATFVAVYVVIRFVEAYGLWRARPWAEWLAALSGAIYIPFEIIELTKHVNIWTVGTLVINVVIVGFMAYGLRHSKEIAAEIKHEHEAH